jgi:hypothetical protein
MEASFAGADDYGFKRGKEIINNLKKNNFKRSFLSEFEKNIDKKEKYSNIHYTRGILEQMVLYNELSVIFFLNL